VTSDPSRKQSAARTVAAGLIGNVLEWFDFAIYNYFASSIGKLFFPSEDPTASTLAAYVVMLVGFVGRPIGSVVLGIIGDRVGRRALLTISIATMGAATLLIGILPGYATIGVAAPILLVLCRIMQGFSLGGEFTGSMVYTTELASPLLRGIISSSTAAGTTLGFILGSASAWIVSSTLSDADAASWGWRIPFIVSVTFCIAGYFLRDGIHESEAGEKAVAQRPPIVASVIADWKPILLTFGITAMTNAAYYLTFTFAVDRKRLEFEQTDVLRANTIALFVVLFAKPLGGWLSDRVGRRRLMIGLQLLAMVLVYPAMRIMLAGDPTQFMLGQALLGIPIGMALGMQGAMLVEIYPLRTRVTSMSIGYSLTLALSGGAMPLIAEWLLRHYHDPFLPMYFIFGYGLIGLLLMVPMRETNANRIDV
jgi:MFS transporter, MHS family, proline/betaine transporter